jgi:hypothetical protein
MNQKRFWISAIGGAVVFAALMALLFPYRSLGMTTLPEMQRAWLLTVFTGGVMAICFGVSGLLSAVSPVTFSEVHDAGSVTAALDARREARRQLASPFYNFAGWTVSTGIFLILIYFAGWISLRV